MNEGVIWTLIHNFSFEEYVLHKRKIFYLAFFLLNTKCLRKGNDIVPMKKQGNHLITVKSQEIMP